MQSRPELKPKEQAELEAMLDQDLAILGQWLGRELSCENFRAAAIAPISGWVTDQLPQPKTTSATRASVY